MVERNDPGGPLAALLGAAVFFWGARVYGIWIVGRGPGGPVPLSVVQIGLMAFSMLCLVYGSIGLVSVWLEGRELRPGMRRPRAGRGILAAGLLGVALLVAAAGFFSGLIIGDLKTGRSHPERDGLMAGVIFLLGAFLLVFYRRFFMDEVAEADDERSEVPW